MTAIVRSLPIPWADLPGSAKDRLSHDALLLAQDAAAIQDAYYMDIYLGMETSEINRLYTQANFQFEVVKFRNMVERLIRRTAREVRKNYNKTSLSDWFSKVAITLHRTIKLDTDLRLVQVRGELSELLFNVKSSEVKAYFVNNPSPEAVDRERLTKHLLEKGLNAEIVTTLVSELNDIEIDGEDLATRSKQAYLNRTKNLGLYPLRTFLDDDQLLLLTIVAYGLASNMISQYSIGKYALITLTTNIVYGKGYREFKMYALADKAKELKARPIAEIISILRAKHVPSHYLNELERFFQQDAGEIT